VEGHPACEKYSSSVPQKLSVRRLLGKLNEKLKKNLKNCGGLKKGEE